MYAIVDIAGQQFKVEKAQKLFVHRLNENEGSKVSFDRVLLIENNGKITLGDPVIKNAAVSATVIEHRKGDKVLVFKKKRRKGYQKLNGHRQYLTQIEITDISEKAAAKPEAKSAARPAEEKEPATSKATAATDNAATKAPAAKKETAAKKPAAAKKETAASKPATEKKAAPQKKAAAPKSTASTESKPAAKKPAAKKDESKDASGDK
jgi:large subunit ribosomal protein L21